MRTYVLQFCFLVLVLQVFVCDCEDEKLGTGVDEERDVMDNCTGAAGPRPINEVYSPGRTVMATVDDVNGGYCGVEINTPGIWWWVNGTGDIMRAGTCHQNTDIKTKISIFTGSCGDLRCVTGAATPDYECPLLKRGEGNNEWGTLSTAVDFPTFEGQHYYILVHEDDSGPGAVWLNFRIPQIPQNNECIDAIGPVPKDATPVLATNVDGTVSDIPAGYCGGGDIPGLYPGVWFQVMGTGGPLSVMACGENNFDGFYFSVYNGADCDSLVCETGRYDINVEDREKCSFGASGAQRPLTKFTFNSRDRDRYYIYVHFARTAADKPTGNFRFFADDGAGGTAGSSGHHLITFEESTLTLKGNEGNIDNDNGNGSSAHCLQNALRCFVLLTVAISSIITMW